MAWSPISDFINALKLRKREFKSDAYDLSFFILFAQTKNSSSVIEDDFTLVQV